MATKKLVAVQEMVEIRLVEGLALKNTAVKLLKLAT